MNHTEVRFSCICQKVKDEITNVLDCTYIGIDDTLHKPYIKKYIPRNRYQSYDFAYLTEHLLDGTKITPHYRIIRLKLEIPALNPYSQNRVPYTYTCTCTIPTSSWQSVEVTIPDVTLPDCDPMYY